MRRRNCHWILGLISVLVFLETPSINGAELGGLFSKVHPYISLQGEYSDNINLTATNKKDELITMVYPGLKFSTTDKNYGMDLDYRLGLVFYAKEKDNNYISHAGALGTWFKIARSLTFRLRDYLVRSDEPRERAYYATALEGQYLLSTTRERVIYIRNVFEPSLEYKFGRENLLSINYRNNIYDNQSPRFEDSQENSISPRLTYWFDIRNGISLGYGLTLGNFEDSPDLVGHMASMRYTHRFNPRTSIFGEYEFLRRDFETPSIDYDVHNPSIGIEHAFTPSLTGYAKMGYFWEIPDSGSKTRGASYNLRLTQHVPRTTYTISFQGGYTEDYFTAENLGFSQYHSVLGSITHQLMEKMSVGFTSSFEWAKYDERKDKLWNIGATASYQVFKWLNASLGFHHRENHSNIDSADYKENRPIFSITAAF